MRLIDADAALETFQGLTELAIGEGATLVKALIFAGLQSRSITPTIDGWINVKDRLPEEGTTVLAFIERDAWPYGTNSAQRKREIAIGYQISGRWHVDGCNNVIGICWMPLPESPDDEHNRDNTSKS